MIWKMIGIALALTTLLVGSAFMQTSPSCSSEDGQYVYQLQVTHRGNCSSDSNQNLAARMRRLEEDTSTLKKQLPALLSELEISKKNQSDTQNLLSEADRNRQLLLEKLSAKEAEFKSSQEELARVLRQAADDIRALKDDNARLLSACKTSQTFNQTGSPNYHTTSNPVVIPPYSSSEILVSLCNFENGTFCDFERTGTLNFTTRAGDATAVATGPSADHTTGGPNGSYALLDGVSVPIDQTRTARLTSPVRRPGNAYCLRFWYHMFGDATFTLRIYLQVNGRDGYPILVRSGNQGDVWRTAEIDLDPEFTAYPFNVAFEATTLTNRDIYGRLHYGDIALDDIFLYKTNCKYIPKCPPQAIQRTENNVTYCYTFHAQPVSWYKAAVECRSEGINSSLVTVTSADEQKFLAQTIKSSLALSLAGQSAGFYTAGTDERVEHSFEWTDTNTPITGTMYTNWKAGQPNNVGGSQNCLLLQYPDLDYQWGDESCEEKRPFICKTRLW